MGGTVGASLTEPTTTSVRAGWLVGCCAGRAQARAPRLLTPRAPDDALTAWPLLRLGAARRIPLLSVAISNDRVAVAASPPHRAPAPSDEAAREGAPRMLPAGGTARRRPGTRRSTWHRGACARGFSLLCTPSSACPRPCGLPEFRRRRGRWSDPSACQSASALCALGDTALVCRTAGETPDARDRRSLPRAADGFR